MKARKLFSWMGSLMFALMLGVVSACSGSNDDGAAGEPAALVTIAEADLTQEINYEANYYSINVSARMAWKASLKEPSASSWLTLVKAEGTGGTEKLGFEVKQNNSEEPRTATIVVSCSAQKVEVEVTQAGTTVRYMTEADVPDFEKYYKPKEFGKMDMFRNDSQWSWFRYKQSEHFFVFWEAPFGSNPNATDLPEHMRVDIDDLLQKAEQFYDTNVNKLKMAEVGEGKSYLDKYKMEIYLLYQDEWLATGSGYDNVIGALWVNPSTCKPVGSVIAHEIGHSFQYQVYCDKLYQGRPDDLKSGFRYEPGSGNGCGFWEQCAQWQSYQDYPHEMFVTYHFDEWMLHCHRHFEHEWMRYASYWLQTYWTANYGIEAFSTIWKESKWPESAIDAYTRLLNGGNWETTKAELYDYAARMATFDIDGMRQYSDDYQGRYNTTLYAVDEGYYQVAYSSCPQPTGFNVIALNVPQGGTTISARFQGLDAGATLSPDDPGNYMESEQVKGTTNKYNKTAAGKEGWTYGFVALKKDKSRVYGQAVTDKNGTAQIVVPEGTTRLYFVVAGTPTEHIVCPWDEKELTDAQLPYKVKFEGTDLLGNFSIDETQQPQDITFTYDLTCDAAHGEYQLGTIDLQAGTDIQQLAQAFVMQPAALAGSTLPIANGTTQNPAEGKVVLGLEQSDGSYSYTYTANSGFYCTADGNQGSWADNDPLWMEYDKDNFVITYGHYPGQSVAGTKYTIRPTLVYTKDGKQYKATFVLNMQF